MAGIVSLGAYIPRYRLSGEQVAAVWGGRARGSRSFANHDEDALTMGADALLNCLEGRDPARVEALYFASTTSPYLEKSGAALLAEVGDLSREVAVAEFGGSLRAGTAALRAAADALEAGSADEVAVVASELRPARAGEAGEMLAGDGAVAFLLGREGAAAELEASYSVTEEFTDVWRRADDPFPRAADARFIQTYGYERFTVEAAEGLLGRCGATREDIGRVLFYAPDLRTRASIARKLGFPEACYPREPVLGRIGDAGAAAPLLELAAALEEAEPGEHLLAVGYGSGAEALLFRATELVVSLRGRRGVAAHLARARPLSHYGKSLRFRGLMATEVLEPFSSPSILWKEAKGNLRLYAQRCRRCGFIQFPRQRVCCGCTARDEFDDFKLARRGKVYSFVADHLVPSPDPPVVMATADLEGGGRFYGQLTDCEPGEVAIDMPVELCFRLLHRGEGYYNYFWKFRPLL
ncbi:MAG: OB-fold domain-containing protein [Nitrospinota bacterium]